MFSDRYFLLAALPFVFQFQTNFQDGFFRLARGQETFFFVCHPFSVSYRTRALPGSPTSYISFFNWVREKVEKYDPLLLLLILFMVVPSRIS